MEPEGAEHPVLGGVVPWCLVQGQVQFGNMKQASFVEQGSCKTWQKEALLPIASYVFSLEKTLQILSGDMRNCLWNEWNSQSATCSKSKTRKSACSEGAEARFSYGHALSASTCDSHKALAWGSMFALESCFF